MHPTRGTELQSQKRLPNNRYGKPDKDGGTKIAHIIRRRHVSQAENGDVLQVWLELLSAVGRPGSSAFPEGALCSIARRFANSASQ